jgi:branched-chain amino acid transport system substrate-binding protein
MNSYLFKKIFLLVAIFSLVWGTNLSVSFAAGETINIGFIGAISTPYGKSEHAAIEIAFEEINAEGGILGRPVRLIAEDSKRQVPLALAAYKKLVMDDECLMIFTEGTEGTTACSQVGERLYAQYPHLLFAVWANDYPVFDVVEKQYDRYKFMFRAFTSAADNYNPKLGFQKFFKDTVRAKKVALLIEDAAWTKVWRDGIPGKFPSQKEAFEKNGIKVVYYNVTDIKEQMFLPILEQIAKSGADTIYWITAYTDNVTLTKQWAQSGAKDLNIVFHAGMSSLKSFWEMTGGQGLGVASFWPEIKVPFTKYSEPFIDKLRAKGGGMMASTYGCYDSPFMLKAAVEKVGNTKDVNSIIKALETVEVQRGFFKVAYDKRHEQVKGYPYQPMLCGQFQENGRYVLVNEPELMKVTNPKDKYIPVKELKKRAASK